MNRETCYLVDEHDSILGTASKFDAHRVIAKTGKAPLHRAFSLFLVDLSEASAPRLLIQKRAMSKITFPLMWANTCCSHPIANMAEEANGLDGVIAAACRKAEHELGIPKHLVQRLCRSFPFEHYGFR
jgi:isopentenyl-diphosphate delta-isomerase